MYKVQKKLAVEDAELELLLDKYLDKELYTEPEIFCRKYSDQIDCTMR